MPGASPGGVRANHPPVSSVAPLADSVVNGMDTVANVNNRGDAYTENLVGQRGDAPPVKRFRKCRCEASNFEEPRAVVPHAGICTGAAGQLAVLP